MENFIFERSHRKLTEDENNKMLVFVKERTDYIGQGCSSCGKVWVKDFDDICYRLDTCSVECSRKELEEEKRSFQPNWEKKGFKNKEDCWRHVMSCLKENQDKILSTAPKSYSDKGKAIQQADFFLWNRRFTLQRNYKKGNK